ncbi:MAG: site-specific integrase [Truepera sp.]|nr:site-specific integrase [Truepera sp.]
MAKRTRGSHNDGIRQLPYERWDGTDMGGYHSAAGRRRRATHTGATKPAVRDESRRVRSQHLGGRSMLSPAMTLGELVKRYLEHKSVNVKPTTAQAYAYAAAKLTPLFGVPLAKLSLMQVDDLSLALQQDGVAPAYVHRIMGILKSVLEQGRRWGLASPNWLEDISRPRVPPPNPNGYTREQVIRFLQSAKGHRFYAMYYLAFTAGLRRGELLGLRWDDIDFLGTGEADVHVRRNVVQVGGALVVQEPKTAAARRRIRVGADTATVLEAHREQQRAERESGITWADQGIVFASELGTYLNTWRVYPPIEAICKAAGIPYDGLHIFRRTSGSLLILEGKDPKLVSRRLGHTDVAFTLRTYQHLYADQYDAAVLSFDMSSAIEQH